MLAEAEAGKIGTIIVKDMSRFGRNYLEVGFYTEILFPKKQIRFIAINNSVDSDKPQDNDFTPFLNKCKAINRRQKQLAYYHRKQSEQKAGEAI